MSQLTNAIWDYIKARETYERGEGEEWSPEKLELDMCESHLERELGYFIEDKGRE